MKNRNLFLVIGGVILLLSSVLLLASRLDRFGGEREAERALLTAQSVSGDVSVRRGSSNYVLLVLVGRDGACELAAEGAFRASLDKDCRALIGENGGVPSPEIEEGAAFFDLVHSDADHPLSVRAEGIELLPDTGAVFSVEAYTGTQTVNVYAGTVSLRYAGNPYALRAGDHISVVRSEDESRLSCTDILASELRASLLRELADRGGLCFDSDDLKAILSERQSGLQAAPEDRGGERLTCTVEIRCDTVLSQPTPPSADLPGDGVILPPTPVKFTQGESVYDVLRRVCKTAGIDLGYNYTVVFGGYYITAIGGLSENDYGNGSGWLFRVNGWFPNYGAGRYEVEDGDTVEWHYSCEGSGADLGRESWTERPAA